jgi:hypothetical protein
VARYQRLRTRHTVRTGKAEEALNTACGSIRFALFLSEREGSLVDAMIASMMLGMALDDAQWVFSQAPELSPSPLVRTLLEVPDMRGNVWKTFQGESRFMINALTSQPRPPTFMQAGMVLLTFDWNAWWLNLPVPELLYQPNNTVQLYLNAYLSWKPYLTAAPEERAHIPPPVRQKTAPGIQNAIGTRVFNSADIEPTVIRVAFTKEAHAHALILMAFLSRGKHPPDAWIPDPFTGRPLTLSEDGTHVVSTGLDQIPGTDDDILFEIPESLRAAPIP